MRGCHTFCVKSYTYVYQSGHSVLGSPAQVYIISSNYYMCTRAVHVYVVTFYHVYQYIFFPGLSNQEEFSFITEEELNKPMKKVRSLYYNVG